MAFPKVLTRQKFDAIQSKHSATTFYVLCKVATRHPITYAPTKASKGGFLADEFLPLASTRPFTLHN